MFLNIFDNSCNETILRFAGVETEKLETEWEKFQDKTLVKYLHSARVTEGEIIHTGKM